MTTPIDVTMPYAVILRSHATNNTLEPFYSELQKGSNTVQIVWYGTEKLDIFSAPEQSSASRVKIAEIPAGTGIRTAIVTIGVAADETAFFGASPGTLTTGRRAVCTVVNVPLKS